MSTSYGAPIELFSVDPATGAETVLANSSATNLLAELPVLETLANGANLGLQLADGSPPVLFASTARTATFLYSVAVQRMQATSFVTDNYNLDMQWLGTIDQPLLEEAEYWTERAASETGERAILDNTQASMALTIASEAPANRSDNSVTIHNDSTGNLTQITVYAAGDGSTIHDIAPSALSAIEPIVSTILNIAATVTGQYYLYIAAAALDAVQAGQAFSQGQDLAGILSLAEAVSAGILGGTGGTTPLGTTPVPDLTIAQQTAQVINLAAEGVGGVYGVVKSAQNGNGVGILASALEAAAAAAAGIGMDSGGTTQQTLNLISTALGAGSVATNVGSDFASGNLAQGLVDSLNLILPAVAQAYATDQTNQTNLQAPLQMNATALAAAGTNPAPNVDIPDFGSIAAAAENAPTPLTSGTGSSGVTVTVAPVGDGGVANVDNTQGSGSTGMVMTQNGQTYVVTATPTSSANTIQATLSGIADDVMSFLSYISPIGTAEAAPALTPPETTLAQQIDTYITTHAPNSPLNGMGSTIVADSVLYGVDPRLLVAVAGAETTYGTNITAGANNIFNNLYSGLKSPFDNVDSAILNEARMIGRNNGNYFGQGLTTTTSFYSTYCVGAACGTGLANLNNFLNALGGNVNNLRWTGQ